MILKSLKLNLKEILHVKFDKIFLNKQVNGVSIHFVKINGEFGKLIETKLVNTFTLRKTSLFWQKTTLKMNGIL